MSEVALELEDCSVRYNGVAVLRDVSLRIARGERVAFVGQSGAGKSTLIDTLYARCQVDASLVPQGLGLVRSLSVFHNIFMGRLNRHGAAYNLLNLVRPQRAEVDRVRAVTRTLGLEAKLFEPVGELSGGQQQRTAVGRALFRGGAIFLGDEPVSAVDEQRSRSVLQAIVDGHETVILSMHDVGLALAFCDRIIGLDHGAMVLDRPARDLRPADLHDLYQQ